MTSFPNIHLTDNCKVQTILMYLLLCSVSLCTLDMYFHSRIYSTRCMSVFNDFSVDILLNLRIPFALQLEVENEP